MPGSGVDPTALVSLLDRLFTGQGNHLLITCIGIFPSTVSNTILERSVESTDDIRDIHVGPFYPTRFFKLHLETEIGISRLGEGLEEDREETIFVVGIFNSIMINNLFL